MRALIGFVDSLVVDVRASDASLAAVRGVLGEREVVEVIVTVGYYMMLARLLRTADVAVEPALGEALLKSARPRPPAGGGG